MTTGEFAPVSDAGWGGLHASPPALGGRSAGGAVGLDAAVAAWETAYRRYGQASQQSMRSGDGDVAVIRQMAVTSWEVAGAWRQIARGGSLPWWSLAALESAAQAFETQARDWQTRAHLFAGPEGGRS